MSSEEQVTDETITLSSGEDEVDQDDDDVYEMEAIVDVRYYRRQVNYQIKWVNFDQLSWEPATSFIGEEALQMLNSFRANNKEKIESLYRKSGIRKDPVNAEAGGKDEDDEGEEDEAGDEDEDEDDALAPRELTEDDSFYGRPVKELQGESRRLFDPTHRQTATDLLLATCATNEGRISRSKAAELKKVASDTGSGGEHSRSQTPAVPKNQPKKRGRKRKEDIEAEEKDQEGTDETDSPAIKRRGRKKAEKMPEMEEKDHEGGGEESVDNSPPVKKKRGRKPKNHDESNEEETVKKAPTRRGRTKKVVIADEDEDDEEEVVEKLPPSLKRATRKIVVEEDERDETPSPEEETTKPKYFIGRDDESDEEDEYFKTSIEVNENDPVDELEEMMRRMNEQVPTTTNFLEAVLKGDIKSARLLRRRIDENALRGAIYTWRDNSELKRPILNHLIANTQPVMIGRTPPNLVMIRFLISMSHREDLYLTDSLGNYAIHEAIKKKNYRIIRLLVLSFSPLTTPNRERVTPIEMVISNRDVRSFKLFLNRGVTYHHLLNQKLAWNARQIVWSTPELKEALFEHDAALNKEMAHTRKKMYHRTFIKDVQPVSPVMIMPRQELSFAHFEFPYESGKVENENQGHFLTIFPVVYNNTKKKWMATYRSRFNSAPLMNDVPLFHAQSSVRPVVFFATPKEGLNSVKVELSQKTWDTEVALALQVVRFERSAPAPPPLPMKY